MGKCRICGSTTINPHLHGREEEEDLDLCDVCYWRKRAEELPEVKKIRESIKDRVREEYQKGNIVFADIEGLNVAPLDEFIKQSADGILYDLNRSEEVVLAFIDDPKWINDYAVAKVIRKLKGMVDEKRNY